MSDPVLEAVALTKRFGPTVALHGVSFAVNPGKSMLSWVKMAQENPLLYRYCLVELDPMPD